MDAELCGVKNYFTDQDAFWQPFDYGCDHVEYIEESESVETQLECFFQEAVIYQ